jgi:hypothetical protein
LYDVLEIIFMFYINYNPNKTLPETFYKKNSDFCNQKKCQF